MFLRSLFEDIRRQIRNSDSEIRSGNTSIQLRSQKISLRRMIKETGVEIQSIPLPKRRRILEFLRLKKEPPTFEYRIKLDKFDFVFFIMFEGNGIEDTELQSLENMLRVISIWIKVATQYSEPTCFPETIYFFLYLLDSPKEIPYKNTNVGLGRNDVNSAFTYACSQQKSSRNMICVYRKEEIFKVLIHEIIHLIGFDLSYISATPILTNIGEHSEDFYISKTFNIPISSFKFEESYTEFLATLIQCMFISPTWRQFVAAVELEVQFACLQVDKILCFNNLNYEFLVSPNQLAKVNYYHEGTAVFSYYVLKTILLFNYASMFKNVKTLSSITRAETLLFILNNAANKTLLRKMTGAKLLLEGRIPPNSLAMTFHGLRGSEYEFSLINKRR